MYSPASASKISTIPQCQSSRRHHAGPTLQALCNVRKRPLAGAGRSSRDCFEHAYGGERPPPADYHQVLLSREGFCYCTKAPSCNLSSLLLELFITATSPPNLSPPESPVWGGSVLAFSAVSFSPPSSKEFHPLCSHSFCLGFSPVHISGLAFSPKLSFWTHLSPHCYFQLHQLKTLYIALSQISSFLRIPHCSLRLQSLRSLLALLLPGSSRCCPAGS